MKKINTRKILDSLSDIFLNRIGSEPNAPSHPREVFLSRIGKIQDIRPQEKYKKETLEDFDEESLDRYVAEDYVAINSLLWHKEEYFGGIEGLERIVKDIIEITDNMSCDPSAKSATVYRGTKLDHYPDLLNIKKGMTLPLKALTSTSLEYATAEIFTENNNDGFLRSNPLIFTIKIDGKTPFIRPTTLGTLYEIEQEIILPPAEYEVIDIKPGTGKYSYTEVEMKLKKPLDIQQLIIDGLDYLIDNDPMDTHGIFTEDIVRLKNKVNNYYKKKRSQKIRDYISKQIDDNQMGM